MTVYRRGSSWYVRVYNRQTKKREYIDSFPDADYGSKRESEIAAKRAELEAKENPLRFGRETCESFALRWTSDYNRSSKNGSARWGAKSIRDMNSALKPFIAAFGPRRLNSLTVPEVRSWAQGQPRNYSAVARTMFSDAVRDGLISSNPFSNLRLEQSRGRKDLVVLTEPEIEELIDTASEVWPEFGSTLAAMIAVAAYTGIRPGELFALTPANVRIEDCELDIMRAYNGVEMKAPKNGKPREGIILPPQAGQRIAQMPRPLHGEFLFQPPRGGLFRKSTLDYYYRPVRVAFGRPGMAWYEMRHSAATLLLERGCSSEDVAWQLGHEKANPKLVNNLYGHPSDQGRRERLKRAFALNVRPLQEVKEAADG